MENTTSLQPVKDGKSMVFQNENAGVYMEIYEDKDNRQTWARGYKIWFNGILVESFKTWKAFEKDVRKRISVYNLQRDLEAEKELNEE